MHSSDLRVALLDVNTGDNWFRFRIKDDRQFSIYTGKGNQKYLSGKKRAGRKEFLLFLLMTVFSQSFFTLVCSNFMSFSFLSARHTRYVYDFFKNE